MELFEAIYRRGSYRDEFMPEPIPEEDLHRILDAGIRAPSGYNLQTTSFYAVKDAALRAELAEVFPTKATKTAPAILVLTSRRIYAGPHNFQFEVEDYAAAAENTLLALTALGYAGVWMDGMMRYVGNADLVRAILHIPEEETIRTIIPFGKPVHPVTQKEKKPFAERAHIL